VRAGNRPVVGVGGEGFNSKKLRWRELEVVVEGERVAWVGAVALNVLTFAQVTIRSATRRSSLACVLCVWRR